MTTYVLEMRSTQNWEDIRYREYTCSARKADIFKSVPKIQFTDSGHGIVPHVREHKGRKLAPLRALWDHVHDHIIAVSRHKSATCHCGKDGHALNSVNCPVHGKRARNAAQLRASVIEECARLVEEHQERITETANGSERSLSPRIAGNQMGLAYASAIRALVTSANRAGLEGL